MQYGVDFLRPRDFYNLGENCDDIYLKVKNVRRGDLFFECEKGVNYKLTALTNARRISDGWYFIAMNSFGEKVEIFASEMTQHPGPNFFKEPQYVTEYNKEIVYIIE